MDTGMVLADTQHLSDLQHAVLLLLEDAGLPERVNNEIFATIACGEEAAALSGSRWHPQGGWERLAIQLRKDIDRVDDFWRRIVVSAFVAGIIIGATGTWTIIRLHLY